MKRSARVGLVLIVAGLAVACGGNGGSTPAPSPQPAPTPSAGNPCVAALQAEEEAAVRAEQVARRTREQKYGRLGSDVRDVYDVLWKHALGRGVARPESERTQGLATRDVGEVAVIENDGTMLVPANTFDLKGLGLRFQPNSADGYDVSRVDGTFRSPLGTRVVLEDDDAKPVTLGAPVAFFGTTQSAMFLHSDGNLTFGRADAASTDRSIGRLLSGPPRIAPFFADLDPSAGGRVFAQAGSDAVTVTWCSVPGFDRTETVTVQATVFPTGAVDMKFGESMSLTDAVVGVSPGDNRATFTSLDLSTAGSSPSTGAVGEHFANEDELDLVSLAQTFYRSHPDNYDQLVIWGDSALINSSQDAFAYETTISNAIRGIGLTTFDVSREFGSAGQLSSIVVMDRLGKYPDDPNNRFLGGDSTVTVLGQESGHRWLVNLTFRDYAGRISSELLGRDQVHWSFFVDSDASVLEGNDIEDLGGGSFRTVDILQRYSLLDQYAMGLVPPQQVPRFFYVESPVNVVPSRDRSSAPRVGVTFNGTRRDVLMEDIIAALGARSPTAAESPKLHRQAYLYLVGRGREAPASETDKVDRIRREFEAFFFRATDQRMRLETRLH